MFKAAQKEWRLRFLKIDTNKDVTQRKCFYGEKFWGSCGMYYNPACDANCGNTYLRHIRKMLKTTNEYTCWESEWW